MDVQVSSLHVPRTSLFLLSLIAKSRKKAETDRTSVKYNCSMTQGSVGFKNLHPPFLPISLLKSFLYQRFKQSCVLAATSLMSRRLLSALSHITTKHS